MGGILTNCTHCTLSVIHWNYLESFFSLHRYPRDPISCCSVPVVPPRLSDAVPPLVAHCVSSPGVGWGWTLGTPPLSHSTVRSLRPAEEQQH